MLIGRDHLKKCLTELILSTCGLYTSNPFIYLPLVFQGMHELLAPIIFILHCDHQAFLHASESAQPRQGFINPICFFQLCCNLFFFYASKSFKAKVLS